MFALLLSVAASVLKSVVTCSRVSYLDGFVRASLSLPLTDVCQLRLFNNLVVSQFMNADISAVVAIVLSLGKNCMAPRRQHCQHDSGPSNLRMGPERQLSCISYSSSMEL